MHGKVKNEDKGKQEKSQADAKTDGAEREAHDDAGRENDGRGEVQDETKISQVQKQRAIFSGYLRALASDTGGDLVENPLLTKLQFVFTDFNPNANKQGIPREEAVNIVRTGKFMPVKVNYHNNAVGGHAGASPIGPIIDIIEQGDELIGSAVMWGDEYPDIDKYLKTAAAENTGVHFSWEILHSDSKKDENNVEWLRNCVVAGITIVDDPAYQGRTPLLAIAEDKDNEREGMNLEEEIKRLTQLLAEAQTQIGDLEAQLQKAQSCLSAAEESRDNVQSELESLRVYKQESEAEKARAEVSAKRIKALNDAGIVLDESRLDFYVSMTDEIFNQYVADLVAVVAKKSSASVDKPRVELPEPLLGSGSTPTTIADLAKEFRSFAK